MPLPLRFSRWSQIICNFGFAHFWEKKIKKLNLELGMVRGLNFLLRVNRNMKTIYATVYVSNIPKLQKLISKWFYRVNICHVIYGYLQVETWCSCVEESCEGKVNVLLMFADADLARHAVSATDSVPEQKYSCSIFCEKSVVYLWLTTFVTLTQLYASAWAFYEQCFIFLDFPYA